MAEIIEVPINSDEIPEIAEPAVTESDPQPEPAPKPKPKPKGRPKGAVGKKKKEPVDEPQKKPKKKARPPPSSESEEEAPRRKKVQPVYEPDNRAIAAEVLHMLSSRHLDRTAAKRDKYRSWFSNPY